MPTRRKYHLLSKLLTKYFLPFLSIGLRPVPTVAESAAKITRNRTLRTPFLRLIRDDGWNASEDFAAELDPEVHWIVGSLLPNEQTILHLVS